MANPPLKLFLSYREDFRFQTSFLLFKLIANLITLCFNSQLFSGWVGPLITGGDVRKMFAGSIWTILQLRIEHIIIFQNLVLYSCG